MSSPADRPMNSAEDGLDLSRILGAFRRRRVLFFATVVEFHGPFFGFAMASFWAATRLAAPLGPRNTIGQRIWPPDI